MGEGELWRERRRVFSGEAGCGVVVAIPACNEADRIGASLAALAEQIAPVATLAPCFGVVIFLNGCSDASFDIACGMADSLPFPLRIVDGDLADGLSHAGGARRIAMDLAADWIDGLGRGQGYVLTTDADSRVSQDWVAETVAAFARGADAVAGTIELDADDEAALSSALRARGALEARYERLLTEIFALLDPRPHDPWPRHACEPGASFALTLAAYRRIGGCPIVPAGEDRALARALDRADLKLRHEPAVNVITSGRLIGRAFGGVADAIRLRSENPQADCDPYLEPAIAALLRGFWRGRVRALHAAGALSAVRAWAPYLHFPLTLAAELAREASFGTLWTLLEPQSPTLQRRSLKPRELPAQIRLARLALAVLRQHPFTAFEAGRADSPACVPAEEMS
jgi:Glycosyl transferase family 2